MHDDKPTVPDLRRYEPGASADRDAVAGTPAWPLGRERLSNRGVRTVALGVSLGANVVLLVGLLSVLVLGRGGGATGQPVPAGPGAGASTTLGTPTASASSQPLAGWLRVTPSSVQLGCENGQQTQFVVLQNGGPSRVQWQAVLSAPSDQAGVVVDPHEGRLAAGASVSIRIENRTRDGDSPGGASSQQGVIRFESNAPDAGAGPSLSYTATICQ